MRSTTPTPHPDSPEAEITHHGAAMAEGDASGILAAHARSKLRDRLDRAALNLEGGNPPSENLVELLREAANELKSPEKSPERK